MVWSYLTLALSGVVVWLHQVKMKKYRSEFIRDADGNKK